MKHDCNVLLLNKSLKELLCLSIQGLQLQSDIFVSHTPPFWSCMLRVKFILEKTLQSFLDFDHRSYIVVLSDMIPFFNPHCTKSCSLPRLIHKEFWGSCSDSKNGANHIVLPAVLQGQICSTYPELRETWLPRDEKVVRKVQQQQKETQVNWGPTPQ